jgi:hypothetical protein
MMDLATVTATPVGRGAPTRWDWTTFATRSKTSAASLSRLISSSQPAFGWSRKPSGHCTATPLDILVRWPATHQPRHSQCHRPPMPTNGAQITRDHNH